MMLDQYLKPNVKRGAIYDAVISVVLGILTAIPLLGCILLPLTCVVGLVLPFAIGWLVAKWGKEMMTTATTPLAVSSNSPYATPAVDGAVAVGVGHLISGLITWIITVVFSGVFSAMSAAAGSNSAGSAATGFAVGAAAGIGGVIFGAVLGAIFGAIGGVLYVLFSARGGSQGAQNTTTL